MPRRTLLAVPELSRVRRVLGSRASATAPPLRVTVPLSPSVPAPLTMTRPRLIVVASKVLAAVRVSVLLPTLVRVWLPLMTPLRVMSPEVTPDTVLIRLPPMLAAADRVIAPAKVEAVEELLISVAKELTLPTPVMVPLPPNPDPPERVKGSAPTLIPFRSRTAPLAIVVPLVVSLKAVALPNFRVPRGTVRVVKLLLAPERVRVFVPVLVKANDPVTLPLSVMSPKPPIAEALPSVRLPDSVEAVGLLFQTAPVKLAASWAAPVPLTVRAFDVLMPLTSRRPVLVAMKSLMVAPPVAGCERVTALGLSMLTMNVPGVIPVPAIFMPFCMEAVELIPVTALDPAVVIAAACATKVVPPMVTTPAGSALAWPSVTVPPWITRSPVNVAVLFAPRNKVPCPAFTKALVAVVPEPRPAPL